MTRSNHVLAALFFAALGSPLTQAQTSIDIAKITCEQFVLNQVTDPRNVIIWLSGYFQSKRGDTVVQVQRFEENAKKVTDFCRMNLKLPVMEAAEKVLESSR